MVTSSLAGGVTKVSFEGSSVASASAETDAVVFGVSVGIECIVVVAIVVDEGSAAVLDDEGNVDVVGFTAADVSFIVFVAQG